MAGMKPFEPQQIKDLLDHLLATGGTELMWCCLAAMLFGVGGRISEILSLTRDDILDEEGRIRGAIRRIKLKARRRETVTVKLCEPLHKYIMPWIDYQRRYYGKFRGSDYVFSDQWKHSQLDQVAAWKHFKRIYDRLGFVKRHGTHGFRKSFAIMDYNYWLDVYSGDVLKAVKQVQIHLGHARLETTFHYLGLDADDPDESINHIMSFLE